MANKLFKTIASAFIVQNNENEAQSSPTESQSRAVEKPKIENYQQPLVNNSQSNESQQLTVQSQPTTQLNEALFDKLCQRLEEENLPGPDYMELKQAVMNENMVKMMPDEGSRFNLAFISLKAAAPSLTKKIVTDSIETYISKLKQWESEALKDIESTRGDVDTKVTRINELKASLEKIRAEIDSLEQEVSTTITKCESNKNDMQNAVGFLISKLIEDKEKIEKSIQ
jgi:hypothetical protein